MRGSRKRHGGTAIFSDVTVASCGGFGMGGGVVRAIEELDPYSNVERAQLGFCGKFGMEFCGAWLSEVCLPSLVDTSECWLGPALEILWFVYRSHNFSNRIFEAACASIVLGMGTSSFGVTERGSFGWVRAGIAPKHIGSLKAKLA